MFSLFSVYIWLFMLGVCLLHSVVLICLWNVSGINGSMQFIFSFCLRNNILSLFFWKKWDNTNFFKCLFIWQSLVEFYQGRIVSLLPLFDWDDPKIVIVVQSYGLVEAIPPELQHVTGIIKCWSGCLMKFI
jgi:hypothetical protein